MARSIGENVGVSADDPNARARLRGKRFALAIYGAFAVAFVVVSTWKIVVGVFGLDAAPLASNAMSGPLGAEGCGRRLRELHGALHRALGVAVSARDEKAAIVTYRRLLSPEWDDERAVADVCAREPHGADAYAALLRVRVAQEAELRRSVASLAPLGQDLDAYLP
jgi:hypothetical protein